MGRARKKPSAPATTRISAEQQVTIPAEALDAAGLRTGDLLEVEVTGLGRIAFRRAGNPFLAAAGTLTGVFPHGHLDELREAWD